MKQSIFFLIFDLLLKQLKMSSTPPLSKHAEGKSDLNLVFITLAYKDFNLFFSLLKFIFLIRPVNFAFQ